MDAAAVLSLRQPPQNLARRAMATPPRLYEQKIQASSHRQAMVRDKGLRRSEVGLLHSGNSVDRRHRTNGLCHRPVWCLQLAALLFGFTWFLSHYFVRDWLQGSMNYATRGHPSSQVYSSFEHLQAYAHRYGHHSLTRISFYLRTGVLSTGVNESIVIPSTTVHPLISVDDHVDPEASDSSESVPPVLPASSTPMKSVPSVSPDSPTPMAAPITHQKEKNSTLYQDKKDFVPLRDFALNTDYIPELTSYTHSNLGLRQIFGLKIFSSIAGFDVGRTLGQSPGMALRDGGNNEQSCWFFPGSHGHLGIRLKERISVDKLTIDHLPRDMLSDFAILQAPRKVILWGRVEGPDNFAKAQIYRENMGNRLSTLYLDTRLFGSRDAFIPLATFEYKLSGQPQSNVQTKAVFQALKTMQMDFQVVVLEILSNWGAVSTCLYRVRVHGDPLKAVALRTTHP